MENSLTKSPVRQRLIGMTLDELRQFASDNGLPRFAGAQIARWIYEKRVASISEMTDIAKSGRLRLEQICEIGLRRPIGRADSVDGTIKYLFSGVGGRDIEAVYIPDDDRATLCVSSQAGCKMGCTFCMTGRQGFHGNLTTADIINQILSVDNSRALTNIVFMGMGEPLDNLPAVIKAIEILTAKWGFAWSPKRITLSSIGKLHELKEIIERTKVHIAISVHSPFPDQRLQLMPVQKAYPIAQVMDLLRQYDFAHQRRLSVEYIMWHGVNDTYRYATALARLIRGTGARVNLIRFHAIPGSDLLPSTRPTMENFRDTLNNMGITATIRASRGEDIMAACGMLSGAKSPSTDNTSHQ